ncbi:MAG TPA: amino acid permease [Novosphingobium sp.]|nr:amino acid permease [Novosphingobium sp.]
MIFGRIKPLEAMLEAAQERGLPRSLGPVQLTLLGVGAIVGTGIFVLTATAAQKAGPGMLLSFVIAGAICACAALCYAEIAGMVPVSGSAYTYTYAVVGELPAWMVGWALILEYAVAASAVSVGWSGYFMGLLASATGFELPPMLSAGPVWTLQGWAVHVDISHGLINIPAMAVALSITALLVLGTRESALVNALLVAAKVGVLTVFIALTLPGIHQGNFTPFAPNGWFGPAQMGAASGLGSGLGIVGAAASIFFAYVGFDAVSTAAEETRNPQRNVPIGLLGSLALCTLFYLLVSAGEIGAVGAQPVRGAGGAILAPGTAAFRQACSAALHAGDLVCSNEALAHVLRATGWQVMGNITGLAANLALPSVILMMMFGQTRIFFVMARDGLLPGRLAAVHPRFGTPHVVTMVTGGFVAVVAALLPVGKLVDISNSGTLFAFLMVVVSVMALRLRDPGRARPFRTPWLWVVGPGTVLGCVALYLNLPWDAQMVLPVWGALGLLVYAGYGYRHSRVGRGAGGTPPAPRQGP